MILCGGMYMEKAKTIAFCGIDGSGKSTQLKLVRDNLFKDYRVLEAKITYSPLNSLGVNRLNNLLLEGRSGLEILRYYLKIQNKEIYNYDFVLYDRHLLCFLAYAYAYGIKDLTLVRRLLKIIKDPDLILYFDISPEESLKRVLSRGKPLDKSENPETLTKARMGYEYLKGLFDNVETIDATREIDNTQNEIQKILTKNHFI